MLITTYKEANQLQSSCISLPTATVPVVTPIGIAIGGAGGGGAIVPHFSRSRG